MNKILLVGSGGYGAGYLELLLTKGDKIGWMLEGIADPYASAGRLYDSVLSHNIPIYESPEAFYQEHQADIVIIATPIMLHAEQAITCMEHGSHVLLEKPVAGSVAEAEKIAKAAQHFKRKLMLGFQWCTDDSMLAFKRDADRGRYGRLLSMKALVLWPRDFAYFTRGTRWAGKCYADDGSPIFDSIASNATAHYLFNELWIAGEGYQCADIEDPQWYATRANAIETFDTIAMTCRTVGGVSIFFAASHAISKDEARNPVFEYTFEKGTAYFSRDGQPERQLEVLLKDGSRVDYGLSDNNGVYQKMEKAASFFEGKEENLCPIEGAIKHIALLEFLWNKGSKIRTQGESEIVRTQEMVWGKENANLLYKSYNTGVLPR